MLEDSRRWDNVKAELEVWLTTSEKAIAGPKATECGLEELHRELNVVEVRMRFDAKIRVNRQNGFAFSEIDAGSGCL